MHTFFLLILEPKKETSLLPSSQTKDIRKNKQTNKQRINLIFNGFLTHIHLMC